jgi:hypothetical protein
MSIFGTPKESRTQLLFRDDGKFIFRKLEVEDTFLQEKNKDNVIVKGWKHFYKLQFPFPGGQGVKADMVTLSFSRDVVLDPYNLIDYRDIPDNKGNPAKVGIAQWLVDVGQARRLKMIVKRGKGSIYDKITLFLGAGFMLEILIILILALRSKAG